MSMRHLRTQLLYVIQHIDYPSIYPPHSVSRSIKVIDQAHHPVKVATSVPSADTQGVSPAAGAVIAAVCSWISSPDRGVQLRTALLYSLWGSNRCEGLTTTWTDFLLSSPVLSCPPPLLLPWLSRPFTPGDRAAPPAHSAPGSPGRQPLRTLGPSNQRIAGLLTRFGSV